MRGWMLLAVLMGSAGFSAEDEVLKAAWEKADYPLVIERSQHLLELSEGSKSSEVQLKLALGYLHEQQMTQALRSILGLIESAESTRLPIMSLEEAPIYEAAMDCYLSGTLQNPRETALRIRETYAPIVAKHSEYLHLSLVLAAAESNLGLYDDLFKRLYQTYAPLRGHFLAQKLRAQLYLKLMEHASNSGDRERLREKVISALNEAMEEDGRDLSVCKMIIVLSKGDRDLIDRSIARVLESGSRVSRSDVYLFVHEAVDAGLVSRARDLLVKGKEWYENSRSLVAAEHYLEKHEKGITDAGEQNVR